eukprot:COSAG02_NODE_455_length_21984_cov_4.049760_12_plen_91_part_00
MSGPTLPGSQLIQIHLFELRPIQKGREITWCHGVCARGDVGRGGGGGGGGGGRRGGGGGGPPAGGGGGGGGGEEGERERERTCSQSASAG